MFNVKRLNGIDVPIGGSLRAIKELEQILGIDLTSEVDKVSVSASPDGESATGREKEWTSKL